MKAAVQRELRAARASLAGRCFEAHFTGRRMRPRPFHRQRQPNPDGEYWDVVELAPDERSLASELGAFEAALLHADAELFAGYTRGGAPQEPAGPALWTHLPPGLLLGCHWFRITDIIPTADGFEVSLESLRHLPDKEFPSAASAHESSNKSTSSSASSSADFELPRLDLNTALGALRIAGALLAALVVGAFKTVEFTGEFIIRFMDSSSTFVQRSTPMFRIMVDFLGKLAAGVFALITVLFRGDRPIRVETRPPPNWRRRSGGQRAIDYRQFD